MKTNFSPLSKYALFLALLFTGLGMQAQINILDRIKRKTEQRANRKIDEKIDEGLDTIEGKNKKEKGQEQEQPQTKTNEKGNTVITTEDGEEIEITEEGIKTEGVTVTIEDDDSPGDMTPNEFIGSFLMEFTESKGGKVKEEGAIHYYVNTFQVAFVPIDEKQKQETVLIFDKRDRTMISKVDDGGKKSATKMKSPKIKTEISDEKAEEGKFKVTRTDETKEIEGYPCVKYIIETEDGTTDAWVTPDLKANLMQVMGGFVQATNGKGGKITTDNFYGLEGMVLEAHTIDNKKGTVQDMFIRKIVKGKVDESVFSLDGYEVMDISNMGGLFNH